MKRIDSFYEYLGSDAECSFAEWLQRREAVRPSLWMRLKTWMGWQR